MSPRGDAIVEADWCVGELIKELESLDLLENTMIVFSSDNGPVLNDGYKDGAHEMVGKHSPTGGLRGGKYSLFDGGTHVPFFVYWKGKIKPVVSDALVCQMDLFASVAKLVGEPLEQELDSKELLSVFIGESTDGREELVIEANGKMALRKGNYAMIPPYKGLERNLTGNELGNMPDYALYDLSSDREQMNDVSKSNTNILEDMKKTFFSITEGYYSSEVEEITLK